MKTDEFAFFNQQLAAMLRRVAEAGADAERVEILRWVSL